MQLIKTFKKGLTVSRGSLILWDVSGYRVYPVITYSLIPKYIHTWRKPMKELNTEQMAAIEGGVELGIGALLGLVANLLSTVLGLVGELLGGLGI